MSQHPLVLLFATRLEAEASLKKLGARQLSQGHFVWDLGEVIISGMGSLRALEGVYRAPSDSEIWNLGIAGALRDDLELFQTYEVGTCRKIIPQRASLDAYTLQFAQRVFPPLLLSDSPVDLDTSDFPIHRKPGLKGDLVDMEGYGIAHAAQTRGIRCRMWKTVSDHCNAQGAKQIRDKMGELSEALAAHLVQGLINLGCASRN